MVFEVFSFLFFVIVRKWVFARLVCVVSATVFVGIIEDRGPEGRGKVAGAVAPEGGIDVVSVVLRRRCGQLLVLHF
jgi:hypothetical protein